MNLYGKNIVITGSNRGIGRAIVEKTASYGANIFACARTKTPEFEKELEDLSIKYNVWIKPIYFDITKSKEMQLAISEIRSYKRDIDGLVNNAGVLSDYRRFNMISMDSVRKLYEVDFFAQMEMCQYISRMMQRKRKGSIIYISSIAAQDGFFSSYDYVSCKAAINAAVVQQARELGECGIRVNAVAPGIILTDMTQNNDADNLNSIIPAIMLRRFGYVEEIADVVAFLLSEHSSYITGQVIRVDGGTNPPRSNW